MVDFSFDLRQMRRYARLRPGVSVTFAVGVLCAGCWENDREDLSPENHAVSGASRLRLKLYDGMRWDPPGPDMGAVTRPEARRNPLSGDRVDSGNGLATAV